MEEKFQIQINGSIEGWRITKEFMNLLKKLNEDYYNDFMKCVKRDTLDYYRSFEIKYFDEMLIVRMRYYQGVLCELLDRCAPCGYYFGLCNENLKGIYSGSNYGFWKDEYPEDDLRELIIKEIMRIRDETNHFSKSSFPWRGDFWNFLRNDNLEFYLNTKNNKELLVIHNMIIKQNDMQE